MRRRWISTRSVEAKNLWGMKGIGALRRKKIMAVELEVIDEAKGT